MTHANRSNGEAGMVGKLLAFWLIVLAILAVVAVDAASVAIAHVHVSDVADNAAQDAALKYRDSKSVSQACKAASDSLYNADPKATIVPRSCKIDTSSGRVKIIVTKHASTLVAGRLSFTKKYVTITETAVAAPPTL